MKTIVISNRKGGSAKQAEAVAQRCFSKLIGLMKYGVK